MNEHHEANAANIAGEIPANFTSKAALSTSLNLTSITGRGAVSSVLVIAASILFIGLSSPIRRKARHLGRMRNRTGDRNGHDYPKFPTMTAPCGVGYVRSDLRNRKSRFHDRQQWHYREGLRVRSLRLH